MTRAAGGNRAGGSASRPAGALGGCLIGGRGPVDTGSWPPQHTGPAQCSHTPHAVQSCSPRSAVMLPAQCGHALHAVRPCSPRAGCGCQRTAVPALTSPQLQDNIVWFSLRFKACAMCYFAPFPAPFPSGHHCSSSCIQPSTRMGMIKAIGAYSSRCRRYLAGQAIAKCYSGERT